MAEYLSTGLERKATDYESSRVAARNDLALWRLRGLGCRKVKVGLSLSIRDGSPQPIFRLHHFHGSSTKTTSFTDQLMDLSTISPANLFFIFYNTRQINLLED